MESNKNLPTTIKVEVPTEVVQYEPLTDLLSENEIKRECTEEIEMVLERLQMGPEPPLVIHDVKVPTTPRLWTDHLNFTILSNNLQNISISNEGPSKNTGLVCKPAFEKRAERRFNPLQGKIRVKSIEELRK